MEGDLVPVLHCVDNEGIVGDIFSFLMIFAESTSYWVGCCVVE